MVRPGTRCPGDVHGGHSFTSTTSLVIGAGSGQGRRSVPGGLKVMAAAGDARVGLRAAPGKGSGMADRVIEELDEAESLGLIAAGGIGRIAYAKIGRAHV